MDIIHFSKYTSLCNITISCIIHITNLLLIIRAYGFLRKNIYRKFNYEKLIYESSLVTSSIINKIVMHLSSSAYIINSKMILFASVRSPNSIYITTAFMPLMLVFPAFIVVIDLME